jgi:GR25 family glycosyltransferase involved in LPS biosynthesis
MKFIIRTTPQRNDKREDCLNKVKKAIPNLIVSEDKNFFNQELSGKQKGYLNFQESLIIQGNAPAVHLEDDILLAENFMEKILTEIAQKPNDIINFFSMSSYDLEKGSHYESKFSMNQCYYIPANLAEEILIYSEIWPRRREHPGGYDLVISDFLKLHKFKVWIVVPNLVDHIEDVSLIDKRRSSKRQSKSFL